MFQGNLPQLMAAYNQWQNEQVYTAALQLSDEQRKADRGAFFKSIHSTLNHILWGDLMWLSRFIGETLISSPSGEDVYADFAELHAARVALDARLIAWADSVTEAWLNEPVTWTSKIYGFTQTIPRWVQVQHFFNHQTHHRGQVGTLLKQYGIDVGITDLPLLPMLHEV
ncbi:MULTISPECIES: DinB family protein [Deefgea]|uniref:Damage-inducible protein DinB n=1 Tax=Deefgea chitinilytica TaxID=570276 RepID=A0ABS2CC49_9NEIS|nr:MULTISPECIES: DinB family protein [Deefgea]MBM5571225.1 damage-inducible protein DinB [Deefgea chitinilytica]MBM9888457.1 damage-inducible protein DinB [Deefgea sp. CFH1-16]